MIVNIMMGYVRDVVIHIVIVMIGVMNYIHRVVIGVVIHYIMTDDAGDIMLFIVSDVIDVMVYLMISVLLIFVFSTCINIMV